MKYFKWISRITAFGLYCIIIGNITSFIGKSKCSEGIYSTMDIIWVLVTILVLMIIGFLAGVEHQKES